MAVLFSSADRGSIQQQQQRLISNSVNRWNGLLDSAAPLLPTRVGGYCFTINRIVLSGASLINAQQQQKLLARWQGLCLNIARINQLTDAVSRWYISRRYITSRAFLTEKNLLYLAIIEGKL